MVFLRRFLILICSLLILFTTNAIADGATLLYQGHASLRITTSEDKVIYIDPYAGIGYDVPADLILVTHQHMDHNAIDLIQKQNPGCVVITQDEALLDGTHQQFELGFVTVQAVEAGYNALHDVKECVGYILTLSDGVSIYISGDTSTTEQMPSLSGYNLDYAFFCGDGFYNMDIAEASACAAMVGAKHSIPYHLMPGALFSEEIAQQFDCDTRIIMRDGDILRLQGE